MGKNSANCNEVAIVSTNDSSGAGNPVPDEQHRADMRAAMRTLAAWGLLIQIVGLFVNEFGAVEVIERMDAPAV